MELHDHHVHEHLYLKCEKIFMFKIDSRFQSLPGIRVIGHGLRLYRFEKDIVFDLSIGLIPIPPGFIGTIGPPGRICEGDDERPILGPIDTFPGLELGIRPLLIRFDDDGMDEVGGGRGLNPG